MPSFNAHKLQDLIDRREAAGAALRDVAERARDIRDERNRILGTIRAGSASHGSQAAVHIDRLLAMPLDQAANLTKETVVGYELFEGQHNRGRHSSGVDYQLWCRYILASQQHRRLASQADAARERFDAEFAIVPNLLQATRSWGFNLQET